MNELVRFLNNNNACGPARCWACRFKSIQEAWEACERTDWMFWAIDLSRRPEADLREFLAKAIDLVQGDEPVSPFKTKSHLMEQFDAGVFFTFTALCIAAKAVAGDFYVTRMTRVGIPALLREYIPDIEEWYYA